MIPTRRLALLLPAVLLAPGCDLPSSVGDQTRIVAALPPAHTDALAPSVEAALEPRSFTVRDERIFDVAQIDPTTDDWLDLRKVRQVLVVGEAADPWIAPALDRVRGAAPRAPAVVQAQNVWSRPQQVTI